MPYRVLRACQRDTPVFPHHHVEQKVHVNLQVSTDADPAYTVLRVFSTKKCTYICGCRVEKEELQADLSRCS